MTYSELLNTPEWKNKRSEIISRDRHRCFNENVISNLQLVVGEGLKKAANDKVLYLIKKDNKYNYITISFDLHQLLKAKGGATLFFIEKFKPTTNYGFSNYIAIRSFSSSQNSKIHLKGSSDYSQFNDWIDVRGLHVHHKYYQLGKQPWNYPEDALITLCWECHEQLHKTEKIKVLNEFGNFIAHFSPCPRCHGAGWFPEYIHVQSGICFQCLGAKFLELMQ